MYDRNVEHPNRYQLVKVEGTDDIFDLVPAPGVVNNDGTLINKNSLLKDATAALFGMGADAVPDDVFKKLSASVLLGVASTPLSQFVEGSTIQLNENGKPVDFIVAKHDYESGLNGAGKTLLVRKNAVDERMAWNSAGVNTYSGSTIDVWFNSNYKSRLDSDVQEQIGTTKFYYTVGGGNSSVSELERSVFALSCTELGVSSSYATPNVEGSQLPTSSLLASAKLDDGSATTQHVRSVNPLDSGDAFYVKGDGTQAIPSPARDDSGPRPRPAFTLPSDFGLNPVIYTVDTKGNPVAIGAQIETGSYKGTGTKGQADQTAITLPFAPKLFVVNDSGYLTAFIDGITYTVFRNNPSSPNYIYYTIGDNGISWYNEQDATYQLNTKATTYYYIAIG